MCPLYPLPKGKSFLWTTEIDNEQRIGEEMGQFSVSVCLCVWWWGVCLVKDRILHTDEDNLVNKIIQKDRLSKVQKFRG